MRLLALLIRLLCQLLTHDVYPVREAAQDMLLRLMPAPFTALEHLAADVTADPEARRRARQVLDKGRDTWLGAAEARLLHDLAAPAAGCAGYTTWPWIDSHPCYQEYDTVQGVRLRAFFNKVNSTPWYGRADASFPQDFPAHREATRLWARCELACGTTHDALLVILRDMVASDRRQCRANPTYRWAGLDPLGK